MMKLTESPRDAMQGLSHIVSTENKIMYLNQLQKVGFDIIDAGSFVSAKAIPQMADTEEVLSKINPSKKSKILIIAGNAKYAEFAATCQSVDYISYPFSVSEVFLQKNLRSNFEKAQHEIDKIATLCAQKNKKLIISLSAAFGNPYGEKWHTDVVLETIEKTLQYDVDFIPLADTFSEGTPERIANVFLAAKTEFVSTDFNLHLHTTKNEEVAKIEAAYKAGCRNFDTVFSGIGGCPMSGKKLVGNLDTNTFIKWASENDILLPLDLKEAKKAAEMVLNIF